MYWRAFPSFFANSSCVQFDRKNSAASACSRLALASTEELPQVARNSARAASYSASGPRGAVGEYQSGVVMTLCLSHRRWRRAAAPRPGTSA